EATEIRTFLIADVRGYRLVTQARGHEAAAKLAMKCAELAREGVEGRGGSVIELRGDEALAVFGSPRQAIRAAVDLQRRFVEETLADPSLPLMVGIGLDAGEAVPMEGGYRGGALNLAARLCGQAGPGEVLASSEVAHLARAVDGVRYIQRGEVHLKGLAEPGRALKVVPEGGGRDVALAQLAPARRALCGTRSRRGGDRGRGDPAPDRREAPRRADDPRGTGSRRRRRRVRRGLGGEQRPANGLRDQSQDERGRADHPGRKRPAR